MQYIFAALAGILAAVLMLDVVGLSSALAFAMLPGPVMLSLQLLPVLTQNNGWCKLARGAN